jgi:hypothetical protein
MTREDLVVFGHYLASMIVAILAGCVDLPGTQVKVEDSAPDPTRIDREHGP